MARQLARLRSALARGMTRRGWKIGINVPEVQRRAGLTHPGVGWLDGAKALASGDRFRARSGARLHVEAEVCLWVAEPIGASASAHQARAALSGVSPALELVDYALPATDFDTIVEHCMFHEACVVGERADVGAAQELGTRWPRLEVAGCAASAIRSDLVPAELGEIAAFTAAFLAEFGERLEPGDWILSGSYGARAEPLGGDAIEAGEIAVEADYGPLGSVRLIVDGR